MAKVEQSSTQIKERQAYTNFESAQAGTLRWNQKVRTQADPFFLGGVPFGMTHWTCFTEHMELTKHRFACPPSTRASFNLGRTIQLESQSWGTVWDPFS